MKEVMLVCDGCSLGNSDYSSGESRAAAVAILEFKGRRKIFGEYLGNCSNQQAEIIAACIGLEHLKEPCLVTVVSDSQYVVKTMTGEFRKKANFDYWARLAKAAELHKVVWTWTRGHAGHEIQEKCDKAAKIIAKSGEVDQARLDQILENG
ncbi:MAG: hypothetical protein JNN15_18035 [Blastocatellia bacterium]|nr:hypothetical protein [Blastocatellia bacterium]